MNLKLEGISKSFGGRVVLRDIDLEVKSGEFVSLIGPSGAGKTTLLKLAAAMESPDRGTVLFDPPPEDENPVILVFQDYVLFPFLSVFENVAFGLRPRKIPREEILQRVISILGYFGLSENAFAYPATLSGGEKQRTALARALVVKPGVILLDEPFANLDTNLKNDTAAFIKKTQEEFGITTLCVTHDIDQALTISDRIGVLLDGRICQFSTPETLFYSPASLEVARFLGPVNIIPRSLYPLLGIDDEEESLPVRAEAFSVTKGPGPGHVRDVKFAGQLVALTVELADERLMICTLDTGFAAGDRVLVKVKPRFLKEMTHARG
jgi:putative spermidine/putrescine transport system ATP-binding protein